jgi:hypothetical protein
MAEWTKQGEAPARVGITVENVSMAIYFCNLSALGGLSRQQLPRLSGHGLPVSVVLRPWAGGHDAQCAQNAGEAAARLDGSGRASFPVFREDVFSAYPEETRVQAFHRGITMSVSGFFSSSSNNSQISSQYPLTSSQFQQLGQDLASGNLSTAQCDFAIMDQALTQSATSKSSISNPIAKEFQQLAADLKSGDLTAAQQDYSTLQLDLQNLSAGLRFHHHHRIRTISGGNLLTDSSPASRAAGVQQAYGARQQLFAGNAAESDRASTAKHRSPEPPIERRKISFVA